MLPYVTQMSYIVLLYSISIFKASHFIFDQNYINMDVLDLFF